MFCARHGYEASYQNFKNASKNEKPFTLLHKHKVAKIVGHVCDLGQETTEVSLGTQQQRILKYEKFKFSPTLSQARELLAVVH